MTLPRLPGEAPKHLLEIGEPDDLLEGIGRQAGSLRFCPSAPPDAVAREDYDDADDSMTPVPGAPPGQIVGQIVLADGIPAPNATVVVQGMPLPAGVDKDGGLQINGVPSGK